MGRQIWGGERGSRKELRAGPGSLQKVIILALRCCKTSLSWAILGEGGKGCSGLVFLVLHETLGIHRTGEPHLCISSVRSYGFGCPRGTRHRTVSSLSALAIVKPRKEKCKSNRGDRIFFFFLRERKRRRAQVTFGAIIP